MAEELGTTIGDLVGYAVRFTDEVSDRTLVKLMTDGILLAELSRDRLLRRYDTLIVDDPAGNPVELFQPTRDEARLDRAP